MNTEDSEFKRLEHEALLRASQPEQSTAQPADLLAAAQAVLDRWDSPKWEWHKLGPTADLMDALRKAALSRCEDCGKSVSDEPDGIHTCSPQYGNASKGGEVKHG